ncbi:amidohydrolase family protein [Ilyonectria robusta]
MLVASFAHSQTFDAVLMRRVPEGIPMRRPFSSYWRTNIWETTTGNFWTELLSFHRNILGEDRILYSVDYPFVMMQQGAEWDGNDYGVRPPDDGEGEDVPGKDRTEDGAGVGEAEVAVVFCGNVLEERDDLFGHKLGLVLGVGSALTKLQLSSASTISTEGW